MRAPTIEQFHSPAVERAVRKICDSIVDKDLCETFSACAMDTLQRAVYHNFDPVFPDTFILSGEKPALFLRDSAIQMDPYIRFAGDDPALALMIKGLVARHCRCILLDPYANAFLYYPNDRSEHSGDLTTMKPGVYERKYAMDSLCFSFRLAHRYWSVTGDSTILTDEWRRAARRVIDIWRLEQNHTRESGYRFQRLTGLDTDTLSHEGQGSPVAFTRMTWSGFRPGESRCELHYPIAGQAFATVALGQVQALADAAGLDGLVHEAAGLREDLEAGIAAHGHMLIGGIDVLANEVDGRGTQLFLDEPQVDSLLGLPYLGYCTVEDPIYRATREAVLSSRNELFVEGTLGAGLRNLTDAAGRIAPMSILLRGLTAGEKSELQESLQMLLRLQAGNRHMRESVDANDANVASQRWVPVANALFAELVFHAAENFPEVLVDFRTS